MSEHQFLSDEGRVILDLCSTLALPERATDTDPVPLTLREWNDLARKIESCPLKRAAALRGLGADELAKQLALPADLAERVARLLDRAGPLSMELESLAEAGLWAVTRADEWYPPRLRDSLKHQAPTVLYGSGEIRMLRQAGVAVIGSRTVDEAAAAFARKVGAKCAAIGMPVVSGGARGTDRLAMQGALDADGVAFGVLADSLERTVRQPDVEEFISDGKLVLLTPYAPTAGFSVGAAMGRNKLIYGLAEFAVVVSSDHQTGGTWAGAVEALKAGWCPVLVRDGDNLPRGNKELLKLGASPLITGKLAGIPNLADWVRHNIPAKAGEPELFDFALRDKSR